jgi:hypothetical protein
MELWLLPKEEFFFIFKMANGSGCANQAPTQPMRTRTIPIEGHTSVLYALKDSSIQARGARRSKPIAI